MKTEEQLIWESYIITEKETPTEFGCLMVYIEDSNKEEILDFIQQNFPDDILDPSEGAETEPHVTVAYGFYPDVDVQEIREYIKNVFPQDIKFKLKDITKFDNDEYDVIKVDVESSDLESIHYNLRDEFEDRLNVTFPEYHPHMTLAYCKKGKADHLINDSAFNDKEFSLNKYIFSEPGMKKKYSFKSR